MTDPRNAAAALAGFRRPRWERMAGWALSVILWAIASDARLVLAALSLLAALVIRAVYVIAISWGTGRSTFWSPWFFAVAAACEFGWLIIR
jgi:hypothetical protein